MKAPSNGASPPESDPRERGSALVVTTIVVFMLMVLSLTLMQQTSMRNLIARSDRTWVQGLAEAEVGIGIKLKEIQDAAGSAASFAPFQLQLRDQAGNLTGTVVVQAEECGSNGVDDGGGGDSFEADVAKVTAFYQSAGTPRVEVTIRAYMRSTFHPAFFKAVYVGNVFGVPTTVRFGPGDGADITFTHNEATYRSGSYELNERDLGVDLNKDGKIDGTYTMSTLYTNRAAWGLSMQTSSGNYRLDVNNDASYGTYSHTRSGVATPSGSEVAGGLRPQDPSEPAASSWENNIWEDGDYVDGDVYVNGDAKLLDGTLMWGDLDTTGNALGTPVTGTVRTGVPKIDPPDMSKLKESDADVIVNAGSLDGARFYNRYTGGSDFYSTFGYGAQGTKNLPSTSGAGIAETTNPNIHLGPSNSSSGAAAKFTSADNGKLYYVKGNLWIHDLNEKIINMAKNTGVTLTIVVEGNLYIGDDFNYNSVDSNGKVNAGVLFLVKEDASKPGNFVDENRNYKFDYKDNNANNKYDAGDEALENYTRKDGSGNIVQFPKGTIADSNNIYNGPTEGQGNIYFMDVKYGTGGVTDGFMYAQNNAYVGNPPAGVSGRDKIYGVNGFLSAGGTFDLGTRNGGDSYINYKVAYDRRIENGTLKFKGIPKAQGGGWAGLQVHGWRSSGGHRCTNGAVGHPLDAATCRGLADASW